MTTNQFSVLNSQLPSENVKRKPDRLLWTTIPIFPLPLQERLFGFLWTQPGQLIIQLPTEPYDAGGQLLYWQTSGVAWLPKLTCCQDCVFGHQFETSSERQGSHHHWRQSLHSCYSSSIVSDQMIPNTQLQYPSHKTTITWKYMQLIPLKQNPQTKLHQIIAT